MEPFVRTRGDIDSVKEARVNGRGVMQIDEVAAVLLSLANATQPSSMYACYDMDTESDSAEEDAGTELPGKDSAMLDGKAIEVMVESPRLNPRKPAGDIHKRVKKQWYSLEENLEWFEGTVTRAVKKRKGNRTYMVKYDDGVIMWENPRELSEADHI